eukprot:scaffold11189_cov22-Tisochrysis_lutea.AAC.1
MTNESITITEARLSAFLSQEILKTQPKAANDTHAGQAHRSEHLGPLIQTQERQWHVAKKGVGGGAS